MNISIPARQFIRAWMGFARGERLPVALTDDDYVMAEYCSEELGKKNADKVAQQFFSSPGKHDWATFVKSIGVKIDRLDIRRMAAEAIYIDLCKDLYITDWPRTTAKFLTEELYACAEKVGPVIKVAIEQSVKYNGRNWRYCKVVADGMADTQVAEDAIEQEELLGMKLPDAYFDDMKKASVDVPVVEASRRQLIQSIETIKEDMVIGELNATAKD